MSPTGWIDSGADAGGLVPRLRRQRNVLVAVAVVTVLGGIAVTLPRALERRKQLKAAHAELLGLQSEVVSVQQQIGRVQDEIRGVQEEIRALTARRP